MFPSIVPGLVSITFRQLSPVEVVALVARSGLKTIEWGGDVHVPHGDLARAREVRQQTEKAGLTVAAYGSYYRAATSEAEGLPFARVLETAVALGTPVIRVWAGASGSVAANSETRHAIAEDLLRVASLAAEADVRVATEFHGGTLTDTTASARRLLLEEAVHSNLFTYWQPPVGMSDGECLASLAAISPKLSHLHVFQWGAKGERKPLSEGTARWCRFLSFAAAYPGTRAAMLEFVEGDSPEYFLRDAATLRKWIEGEVAAAGDKLVPHLPASGQRLSL